MKEVSWQEIPKAEFIFAREGMMMNHNYLCAICKEGPAIMETWHGILQPCYKCQKIWRVVKISWIDKLLGRLK